MQKKYHLIAIGGSVMHNLALDLFDMGHKVTGSDDEIYEPSRSRLKEKGLLPDAMGWDPDRVENGLDAIILGKHAREDNPELKKALDLGLPVYSFPEFIARFSKAKKRVCIAGSHGKTSTTGMIMHVLRKLDFDFDYLVGAQLKGFDKMVRISGAELLVTEGDEYPSSALDTRAKMLHYKADIAVITGVAWDHVNIYKTYDAYLDAFRQFLQSMPADGVCFFDQSDAVLNQMMLTESFPPERISYRAFTLNRSGKVLYKDRIYPVRIFGRHNMLNMSAAFKVCSELGIPSASFFESMADFTGASKRLELLHESDALLVYRDFAHAPSKCLATVQAVRERYPDRNIKAVLELHTYSSLDIRFIGQYKGSMDAADKAYVFYDSHALAIKKMPALDANGVFEAFGNTGLSVVTDSSRLEEILNESKTDGTQILLIMSSGALGSIQLGQLFT